jgi:hypothetical protein
MKQRRKFLLLRNGKKVNTAGGASGSRRGRARPRPGDEGELAVSGEFHCEHDGKARNVVRWLNDTADSSGPQTHFEELSRIRMLPLAHRPP